MGKSPASWEYERLEGYAPVASGLKTLQRSSSSARRRPGRWARAAWTAARRSATTAARSTTSSRTSTTSSTAATGRRRSRCCTRPTTSRVHRPHLPGALRGGLHAERQRRRGRHQEHRARDHRPRLGRGLGRAAAARAEAPARRSRWSARARPGLAAAQQLARAGHDVTVFEKNDRIGGLLRYGIPDFKMEKHHIDRRIAQMQAEGVVFRTGVLVGALPEAARSPNWAKESIAPTWQGRVRRRVLPAAPRSARPAGAGARPRRHPLRDGVPAAAEQGQRRRQGQGPDQRRRQACRRHRRRRHRQRLRRHEQPPRREERDAVRAAADAARGGPAARLAVLADQAAHLVEPRGGLRARVRDRQRRSSSAGQGGKVKTAPRRCACSGKAARWSRCRASRPCRPTWCCSRWASSAGGERA